MTKLFKNGIKLVLMVIVLSLVIPTPSIGASSGQYKVKKVDIDFNVDWSGYFHDGVALITIANDYEWATAYLNRDGELLDVDGGIAKFPFSGGLAAIDRDGLEYIDNTGKVVLSIEGGARGHMGVLYAGRFVDGQVLYHEYTGELDELGQPIVEWYAVDRTGKRVDKKIGEDTVLNEGQEYMYEEIQRETINILGETVEGVGFNEGLALVGIPEGPNAGNYIVEKIVVEVPAKDSNLNLKAEPTSSEVLVNGVKTAFDSYLIDQNNYFKLRDLATVVSGTKKQFEVSYDNNKKAINLISNKAYTSEGGEMTPGDGKEKTPLVNTSKIYIDGEEVELKAYTINNNNYFKLRDIAQIFNIGVDWDNATKTVIIDTNTDYIAE